MSKKNFKDKTANIDRFFSKSEPEPQSVTHSTQETHGTQSTPMTQRKPAYYRINLRLRPHFRLYLDTEAWKAKKSITEYINDLIQADMDNKINRV